MRLQCFPSYDRLVNTWLLPLVLISLYSGAGCRSDFNQTAIFIICNIVRQTDDPLNKKISFCLSFWLFADCLMRFELNRSQHWAKLYSLFIGYNFQFAIWWQSFVSTLPHRRKIISDSIDLAFHILTFAWLSIKHAVENITYFALVREHLSWKLIMILKFTNSFCRFKCLRNCVADTKFT